MSAVVWVVVFVFVLVVVVVVTKSRWRIGGIGMLCMIEQRCCMTHMVSFFCLLPFCFVVNRNINIKNRLNFIAESG